MFGVLLAAVSLGLPSSDYVFTRGQVLVHSRLGVFKSPDVVCEPVLSPDLTKVLYWRSGEVSPVVEIDLKTRKRRTVVGTNARSPFYSPDGKTIFYTQSLPWQFYSIPATGGMPKLVYGARDGASGLFQPTWSPDTPGPVIHDMETLYFLDGSGKLRSKLPLAKVMGGPYLATSATRFVAQPNHPNTLAYDRESPASGPIANAFEGMASAIVLVDLRTYKRRPITPKSIYARNPTWTRDGSHVLFVGAKKPGKFYIYSVKPDGSRLKRLSEGDQPGT